MTTKNKDTRKVIFLSQRRLQGVTPAASFVTSRKQILLALARQADETTVWIERGNKSLLSFLIETLRIEKTQRSRHMLLALSSWPAFQHAAFSSVFGRAILSLPASLPANEIAEVLASPNPENLCLGGFVDGDSGFVTLIRGDLSPLLVRLNSFEPTATGPDPDFTNFEIRDYGQTVAFGEYEAAFDALLYENDASYRRGVKKSRQTRDRSFGASIRRLRKQRKLSRSGFTGLAERTIGRIERGEIDTPHRKSLNILAKTLRVPVEDLGSY